MIGLTLNGFRARAFFATWPEKASPFERFSIRAGASQRGERALASANANLREGDMDGAVNRAYYAIFNVARAALLSAGIPKANCMVLQVDLAYC